MKAIVSGSVAKIGGPAAPRAAEQRRIRASAPISMCDIISGGNSSSMTRMRAFRFAVTPARPMRYFAGSTLKFG
jgi:hypothetical protein